MKDLGWFVVVALVAFPKHVLADVITPLSLYTMPIIPFIILIEACVLWVWADKFVKVHVGFWKSILVTSVANMATSLLGTFIPLYKFLDENLKWIGVAFAFSVLIEWGIYLPFFRRARMGTSDLLSAALVGNIITYAIVVLMIPVSHEQFRQLDPEFISVQIESHPSGGGYASKAMASDGEISGSHLSGDPAAPRVFQSTSEATPNDMWALKAHVAGILAAPPAKNSDPPKNGKGYTTVTVVISDSARIVVHAGWGEKFDLPEIQAVWDLVYKQEVGGW